MITHLIKSINWVDAALVFLFIRIIFVGVKSGFIAEFFKSLGVVVAVFISLHYYSFLAAWVVQKTHLKTDLLDFVIFGLLWLAVGVFFKFFRDGILYLFKVETTHEGFDKYAAGVIAVARGILVCSLTIYLIFLTHNGPISRMAQRSYSYKIAGHAAVGTYNFIYSHLIEKLCPKEHYNYAVTQVESSK